LRLSCTTKVVISLIFNVIFKFLNLLEIAVSPYPEAIIFGLEILPLVYEISELLIPLGSFSFMIKQQLSLFRLCF
jgi:hypothetical protein